MHRVAIDTNTLVSGLFFKGNERVLLNRCIDRKIKLILSEDVIEETRNIINRKFSNFKELIIANTLFQVILQKSEIIKRDDYREKIDSAKRIVRDMQDSPIIAFILHSRPDFFISGDDDILALEDRFDTKIIRTKEFLDLIE